MSLATLLSYVKAEHNPAAWCQEFRYLHQAQKDGPKTSDEAHAMMARKDQLFAAIKRNPDGSQVQNPPDDGELLEPFPL